MTDQSSAHDIHKILLNQFFSATHWHNHGIAATIGSQQWQQRQQQQQAQIEALLRDQPRQVDSLLASAFEADARKIDEGQQL